MSKIFNKKTQNKKSDVELIPKDTKLDSILDTKLDSMLDNMSDKINYMINNLGGVLVEKTDTNYFKIEKSLERFNDNFSIHKDEITKYLENINNHKYVTQTNYEQYIPKIYQTNVQNNAVLNKVHKSIETNKQTVSNILSTKKQIQELKLQVNNIIKKLELTGN